MNDKPTPRQGNAMDQTGVDQPSRAVKISPNSDSSESVANEKSRSTKELSPEEQMALYEKELKENDWGHQPC
jgi:hypothetical protein